MPHRRTRRERSLTPPGRTVRSIGKCLPHRDGVDFGYRRDHSHGVVRKPLALEDAECPLDEDGFGRRLQVGVRRGRLGAAVEVWRPPWQSLYVRLRTLAVLTLAGEDAQEDKAASVRDGNAFDSILVESDRRSNRSVPSTSARFEAVDGAKRSLRSNYTDSPQSVR